MQELEEKVKVFKFYSSSQRLKNLYLLISLIESFYFAFFPVNEVFHCVHFECPAQQPTLTPLGIFGAMAATSLHERNDEVDSVRNALSLCISVSSSTD